MRRWIGLVVLVLVINVQVSAAQETTVISPALEAQMLEIESVTRKIRHWDTFEPIVRRFPTRADVVEYLEDVFDADLTEEDAWRTTQFYAAFDLLPRDFNLREVYLDLMSSQVAGFYDPDTKEMNVVLLTDETLDDDLPLLEEIVYAHEYTHALQDQRYGLRELGFTAEESFVNPDRVLAIQALIEGDATVVMNLYTEYVTLSNPFAAFELLVEGIQAGNLVLPGTVPPILVQETLLPYEQGAAFVTELYRHGNWDAVNEAYSNLPQSTEHIIHPERYIAGDNPQAVTVEPLEDALGEGWELLWDRTLGEFYLRAYLGTQLRFRQSSEAAEGWGGDRYRLYYNEATDQLAWVLRLNWDTDADAREFVRAYREFGNERFEDGERDGECWRDRDEALCRRGETDTLIAYAPDIELALAMLEAQGE